MGLYDILWDDKIWFPENSTGTMYGWKDLQNQPGSDVYFPELRDLNLSILLGAVLILVRFIFERFIAKPLGYYVGVSRKKPNPPPANKVLEQAHRSKLKIDKTLLQTLCKQTDMTERQIQTWLRKRKAMDSPLLIDKFAECSWLFLFYAVAGVAGSVVLWNKPWLWQTKYCWIGWPLQNIPRDVYWYYTIEASFYWGLVFTLFSDTKRKDFTQMAVHHFATLVLIYFSWMMNLVRMGTLVLLLHDAADPILALGKLCNYSKHTLVKEICFTFFIIVWFITRLGFYPFCILWSTTVEPYQYLIEKTFFTHWFFNFFLYMLMILHLMWTYSIIKVAARKFQKGDVADVRSDSESNGISDSD
ncbi:ceramide synthase 2-like [Mya arenaria]|uniref:ceramide synthase 2-like n=1 Tax=Mya arenaria TaxID=6604 RepID=UPI0022E3B606|nr:ceramide synthase 2-like [Mya arenaria]